MRGPISSKADTCTETADVYAAGISVKVTRITLGGLSTCHWILLSRGGGMGGQKSADRQSGHDTGVESTGIWPRTDILSNPQYGRCN